MVHILRKRYDEIPTPPTQVDVQMNAADAIRLFQAEIPKPWCSSAWYSLYWLKSDNRSLGYTNTRPVVTLTILQRINFQSIIPLLRNIIFISTKEIFLLDHETNHDHTLRPAEPYKWLQTKLENKTKTHFFILPVSSLFITSMTSSLESTKCSNYKNINTWPQLRQTPPFKHSC